MNQKTKVKKDLSNKSITISRELDASLEMVWRAYTESELLDQWWGPSPWRVETKTMNFSVGGHWLYAMVSPENQKHWARMNYVAINKHEKFAIEDFFCDETGHVDGKMPSAKGEVIFMKTNSGTNVDYILRFATEEALKQMIEMGYEQGMSQCLEQLEELLAKKKS
ncbi:hypothetical protein D3C87_1141100 [compost metagenome]